MLGQHQLSPSASVLPYQGTLGAKTWDGQDALESAMSRWGKLQLIRSVVKLWN